MTNQSHSFQQQAQFSNTCCWENRFCLLAERITVYSVQWHNCLCHLRGKLFYVLTNVAVLRNRLRSRIILVLPGPSPKPENSTIYLFLPQSAWKCCGSATRQGDLLVQIRVYVRVSFSDGRVFCIYSIFLLFFVITRSLTVIKIYEFK
jgi:hypothetical protein